MRGGCKDEQPEEDELDYTNLFLVFGCEPGRGVNADSTLAVELFAKLKEAAYENGNGRVILP